MWFYIIFLILSLQHNHISAFPPTPLESLSQTNRNLKGYECGNHFFTDSEVKETLSEAQQYIDKGHPFPQKYRSELYSESRYEDYFLYPIRNGPPLLPHLKKTYTVFYVVLKRKSIEEVDVVSKTPVGDYNKCIRRDSTHIGPSYSVPENANGYMCGYKFLNDEIIHQSLALAQTKVEGKTTYPSPFAGHLYSDHSEHLVWPILRRGRLYTSGTTNHGPYFLILDKQKMLVDVVIKGYSGNFLRCIRSRKPPTAPESDPYSDLFVPPPRSGFVCGKIFYDIKSLEKNARIIEGEASKVNRSKYPVKYSGNPFNEQCLIWPILPDGKLYRRGFIGPYRLILTLNYKVLCVAMFVEDSLKACERQTIIAKKKHDTSDYDCNKHKISHQQLMVAAQEACMRMKSSKRVTYPASYKGSRFELDGPYFTFPVLKNGVFGGQFRQAGLHRVVINMNCEVVGALTTLEIFHNRQVSKRLVKCHRLTDGPLPPRFFGPDTEVVSEN